MNRFMKFLLLGLLLAPLIGGCGSSRFTSTIKNQDFQTAKEVKFNIKNIKVTIAGGEDGFVEQQYKQALSRRRIMREAKKAYPGHFATEGDAVAIDLEIKIDSSDNFSKQLKMSGATLFTIPIIGTLKNEVELNVKIQGQRNNLLLRKSSKFRQETTNWFTVFTPLGLIPIPGKSDIPKLTGVAEPGKTNAENQFLRRSIVNGVVKILKDSDMRKMVSSFKRSKRRTNANKRFEKRLLQGESALAMKEAETKQPLVLMPLRTSGVAAANRPAMESALASGLSKSYKVYFGKRVADKVRDIYTRATAEAKAGEECDDTMCLQDIGISFQSELVASANVLKNATGYILTLNVTNVFDDVVVMSESIPCKGCDEFQVVERLKTISKVY
ncbi:MAG: hypothetical protein IMF07_05265 [Proteobacteria bacterium]|nr:hypothetical protein [Pseudomonadota bacterium]